MTPIVLALVFFAAVLHASWNAVLRSSADRLWAVTVMSYATTLIAAPFALLLPAPAAASWSCLLASAVLQVGYCVFLASAYRHGELGQVYPIVRGSAPPLVTLGAFLFAGQRPSAPALLGVALISAGVLGLALGRGPAARKPIVLALITGVFVAAYVTVDGIGVRRAGNAQAYAAWLFILCGVFTPLAYRLLRGRFPTDLFTREGTKALVGGVVSLLSYGAILSALALGPLGPISALRETSVVFSALIGRLFLQERMTPRRLLACAAVTLGAIAIGLTSHG
jgi:drug/metabolite transporter (DMT)-like permease